MPYLPVLFPYTVTDVNITVVSKGDKYEEMTSQKIDTLSRTPATKLQKFQTKNDLLLHKNTLVLI